MKKVNIKTLVRGVLNEKRIEVKNKKILKSLILVIKKGVYMIVNAKTP
jgi:hypothetical protein